MTARKTSGTKNAIDPTDGFFVPTGPDIKILPPIKETGADFDALEALIIKAFKKQMYYPMLAVALLERGVLPNAPSGDSALTRALKSGRISYRSGTFSGKFSAEISKELKSIGARWDKKAAVFKLYPSELPPHISEAVVIADDRVRDTFLRVDRYLGKILPENISDAVNSKKIFDTNLFKLDKDISNTLKNITVVPKLTPARREKISREWQDNMDLWIKKFSEEHIKELRTKVHKHAFAGGRYEDLIGMIQKSYGVTTRKARFLARQETSLLMAKYKETRYTEVGVDEYIWGCVAGSKNHPVRPAHKALLGTIQRWDNPPVTTEPGEPVRRNNPGQDYNCRCFARPIVRRGQVK